MKNKKSRFRFAMAIGALAICVAPSMLQGRWGSIALAQDAAVAPGSDARSSALYTWQNPLPHPAKVQVISAKGIESTVVVPGREFAQWKLDRNYPHQLNVVFTFLPAGASIQALDSQGLPTPVTIEGPVGDARYELTYDFTGNKWSIKDISPALVREGSVESVRNHVLMIYQNAVEWNKANGSAQASSAPAPPIQGSQPATSVAAPLNPSPAPTPHANSPDLTSTIRPATEGVTSRSPSTQPAPALDSIDAPPSVRVLQSDLLRQNSPRDFEVKIAEVGRHNPATPGVIQEGETIECTVVSNRDCYITIVGISLHARNPSERFVLLYPNHFQPDQMIKAGQPLHLPGVNSDGDPLFAWRVRPPLGVDFVKVFATLTPPKIVDDQGRPIDRSMVPMSQPVAGLPPIPGGKSIGVEAPEPRIFSPKISKQFDDQSWSTHTIQLKTVPATQDQ